MSTAFISDLYQLTMAAGYFETGLHTRRSTFYYSFRSNPFAGGYAIFCGAGTLCEQLQHFQFDTEQILYLKSLNLFSADFLQYLTDWRFTAQLAMPAEGTVVFAGEPIATVTGSLIDCQLIETLLLNTLNFQTLVATKAARCYTAAQSADKARDIVEFGARRAHGPDGALSAARAAYIGGCIGTSLLDAGQKYDIPVFGTMAHSWVMAFEDELTAFRSYAQQYPHNSTFLLDTYNSQQGIQHAIIVAQEMASRGEQLQAVRFDSGDLAHFAKLARQQFDEAGLHKVKIMVTNDLDEYTIESLVAQAPQIDIFGVGTKLATGSTSPLSHATDLGSLSGVYKMSGIWAADGQSFIPKMKVSDNTQKQTLPGELQVLRSENNTGYYTQDSIILTSEIANYDLSTQSNYLLLNQSSQFADIKTTRVKVIEALSNKLPAATQRLLNPQIYPVVISQQLESLRGRVLQYDIMDNC